VARNIGPFSVVFGAVNNDPTPCRKPRPGPLYWEWRCLNCGHAIGAHEGLRRRLWRKLAEVVGNGG